MLFGDDLQKMVSFVKNVLSKLGLLLMYLPLVKNIRGILMLL